MENEFMKRGYLLPDGCKDLIDVLTRKRSQYSSSSLPGGYAQLPIGHVALIKPKPEAIPLPQVKGEISIPAQTTVSQLAALVGQKPLLIIADLMQMGIFAGVCQVLGFEAISRVARKYGFIARKAY